MSRSVTADDVRPRILAQCANSQSHWERNGAQTDSSGSTRLASFMAEVSCGPAIGTPAEAIGKRSMIDPCVGRSPTGLSDCQGDMSSALAFIVSGWSSMLLSRVSSIRLLPEVSIHGMAVVFDAIEGADVWVIQLFVSWVREVPYTERQRSFRVFAMC